MSKESFISYAREHPEFATQVLDGKVTWQQLYEIYEIYGENHSVWNSYFPVSNSSIDSIASSAYSLKDFLGSFKIW